MNNWARGSNTIRCRTVEFWEQCWLNLQPTCYQCSSYTLYGRALIQWKSSFQDVFNLIRWLGKWPPRKIYLSWYQNQHLSAVVGGQLGQTTISKNNFFRAKIITRKIWAQKLKTNLCFTYDKNVIYRHICIFSRVWQKHVLRKCEKAYCT